MVVISFSCVLAAILLNIQLYQSSAPTGSSAPAHRHPVPLPWAHQAASGHRHPVPLPWTRRHRVIDTRCLCHGHQARNTELSAPGHRRPLPLPWAHQTAPDHWHQVPLTWTRRHWVISTRCLCHGHRARGTGSSAPGACDGALVPVRAMTRYLWPEHLSAAAA